MTKRILALLLALLLCVSMIGCQKDAPEEQEFSRRTTTPKETKPKRESTSTPLLYKVTDDSGNVIWLFGSIHVGLEEFYPLPDYVLDAFRGSDALAVEFDIVAYEKDLGAQMKSIQKLLYTDGTQISDHIPQELYDRAVAIGKENKMYNKAFDSYVPMVWVSLIDNILMEAVGADMNLGIDKNMIEMAYDMDKPVLDVESAEFQYEMLAGFSEELQIMLLEQSVASYEELDLYGGELIALMEAWMQGDEQALTQMVCASPVFENEEEAALYAQYEAQMVTNRNQSMTRYAAEALENGQELFICVGAGHIVGEGGMVRLLEEMGYTVTNWGAAEFAASLLFYRTNEKQLKLQIWGFLPVLTENSTK